MTQLLLDLPGVVYKDKSCSSGECFGTVCDHYKCGFCGGDIHGITGSYGSNGCIFFGYLCAVCGRHLYADGQLEVQRRGG
jgi:DNA-directed RNA polymerase subunit RPC12/RpoP